MPKSILHSLLMRHMRDHIASCAAAVPAGRILDFGPVPLVGAFPLPIEPMRTVRTPQVCPVSDIPALAVSSFALDLLRPAELQQHLDAVHSAAHFALFVGFKEAERNIELPACLLFSGLRRIHSSGGNLEAVLYDERRRFRPRHRRSLLGGALTCILTDCLRADEASSRQV